MAALGTILYILLDVSLITLLIMVVIEIALRFTNRGTIGRGMWSSLLIGTGIVLLLALATSLSV